MNYTERLLYSCSPEYDKHFWNAMRGSESSYAQLSKGKLAIGHFHKWLGLANLLREVYLFLKKKTNFSVKRDI